MLNRFIRDDRGLETIEYAIMTALIVAGIVAAVVSIGESMNGRFGETEATINGI